MIDEITGDIFAQEDINIIIHCCNLSHCMGAGIAAVIAALCPAAVAADNKTPKSDESKLGTFSFGKDEIKGRPITIVNLYGQSGVGNDGTFRNTRYDAVYDGLVLFRDALAARIEASDEDLKPIVGIPYGMASDLAGGSWTVVRAIIESVFKDAPFVVVIVKLPTAKELK